MAVPFGFPVRPGLRWKPGTRRSEIPFAGVAVSISVEDSGASHCRGDGVPDRVSVRPLPTFEPRPSGTRIPFGKGQAGFPVSPSRRPGRRGRRWPAPGEMADGHVGGVLGPGGGGRRSGPRRHRESLSRSPAGVREKTPPAFRQFQEKGLSPFPGFHPAVCPGREPPHLKGAHVRARAKRRSPCGPE